MIRPFGLRHILKVRALQRTGIWLDLFHCLLLQRSALATAMIAPVPWVGTGLATYVWDTGGSVKGFIQMLRRPGRQEADLLFLAPAVDSQSETATAWTKLVSYCVQDAGQHDMRRLFASLPVDSAAIDLLTALGFATYSNEDVLVLNRPPRIAAPQQVAGLRPRSAEDVWWLRRLYGIYTPLPVQHSEGLNDGAGPTALSLAWWELADQQGYVVDQGGDITGGVQLVSGRGGHWLLLHGDPGNGPLMATLVRQGLSAVAGKRRPVYCAVRDYQGGLRATLHDAGFEPYDRRARMVKHLAVRVKATETVTVPGMVAERHG
ncbi:MAG: hypothetical protein R2844_12145 [Caldilineales bacterium]